jgi:hypothetical protein
LKRYGRDSTKGSKLKILIYDSKCIKFVKVCDPFISCSMIIVDNCASAVSI